MKIFGEYKATLFAIILLFFFMAEGCQSQQSTSQEQAASVPTKTMTTSVLELQLTTTQVKDIQPTATQVKDIQPTATQKIPPDPTVKSTQPSLVSTNIPRPTSKATQPSQDVDASLSDLMMTWEDVYAWEDASGYDSNIRRFFEDQVHYIIDRSVELDHLCLNQCIKQIWYTEPEQHIREDGKEFTYFRKITIITMLTENNDQAANMAESMLEEFNFVSFNHYGFQDHKDRLIAPLEITGFRFTNYGSLYGLPGYHIILATARGPYALLLISYNPPAPDEHTIELDLIIEFANVQLFKLEQAGAIP